MNSAERFALCLKAGRAIVQAYREEAPEGCDPQCSYVAIAGTVISVGVGAYQANQQQKQAKKAQEGASGQMRQAYGSVPQAAEYQRVDYGDVLRDTLVDNSRAIPNLRNLVLENNNIIDQDAMTRATRFIPGYKQAMKTYAAAGQDLLNGRLPYEDVLGIISDGNEARNVTGIPGSNTAATLKDLGLSRLDAIKTGGGILQQQASIAEQVNPVSRRLAPQSMLLNPSQAVGWEMEQNQLEQQSLQNKYNLAATGDPAAAAQLQLQLAQQGRSGGGGTDYSQIIGSALQGGLQAYAGSAGGGASYGAGRSLATAQAAAPANAGFSMYNGNYIPRASSARPAYYNGTV